MDERKVIHQYNELKSGETDLTPLIKDIDKLNRTITPKQNLELKSMLVGTSMREGSIRGRSFELLRKKIRQINSKFNPENMKRDEGLKHHETTAKIFHAVDMRRRRLDARRRTHRVNKKSKPPLARILEEDSSSQSSNSSASDSDSASTPLNIYNGTPSSKAEGRLNRDLRKPLPINELNGTPPKAACPISNLHRCKEKTSILQGKQKNQAPPYRVSLKNTSVSSHHGHKLVPSSSPKKQKPKKIPQIALSPRTCKKAYFYYFIYKNKLLRLPKRTINYVLALTTTQRLVFVSTPAVNPDTYIKVIEPCVDIAIVELEAPVI